MRLSTGTKEATSGVHFIIFFAGMQEANCDVLYKGTLEGWT